MPVQEVDGGHRWGDKGKVYKGEGSKEKAARQGKAIHANKSKSGKK